MLHSKYLFSNLLKLMVKKHNKLDNAKLYKEYKTSNYNNNIFNEYDCMVRYIKEVIFNNISLQELF